MSSPPPSSSPSDSNSAQPASDPSSGTDAASANPASSDGASAAEDEPSPSDNARLSEVRVGIHFATNRRGKLHARLLRTQDGNDETDIAALMDGFSPDEVIVRGRIRTNLNLNALFAEGLFADRSLDERKLDQDAVDAVDHLQREDATPLRDGESIGADSTYDLTPDDDTEAPPPDAVRVAIPFMTDHAGAVCARLDLDDALRDTTSIEAFENVFAPGKALVRGKIRADVNLEALFDARIVDGNVDPGTMYMPPSS